MFDGRTVPLIPAKAKERAGRSPNSPPSEECPAIGPPEKRSHHDNFIYPLKAKARPSQRLFMGF
jgi:hypothetical protein